MVLKTLFTGQQWRNRHREQTYGHGERGGGGEMYGKSKMETYTTICKIDNQWEFAVCLRELKPGLSNNLEGWDGEGDGTDVQVGGCCSVVQSCLNLCDPWTAAYQVSLSFTISQSLLKLMSILFSVVPFSSCLQSFPGSFLMS